MFILAALLSVVIGVSASESWDIDTKAQKVLSAPSSADPIKDACDKIKNAIIKDSGYFARGFSKGYRTGIEHYVVSSQEIAFCVVEPGSVDDVRKIMEIISKDRIPFAVKGGGHTGNKGFSSSTGVQIAMSRFNKVIYHSDSNTADIGAGAIWDQVYAELAKFGVSVVGGRDTGVGVGGLTLGGGYSWFSNERGLVIDNVLGFEVVLPNGTVVDASESSYKDLFIGLKGGLNNFGVVTRITFDTFKQGNVWGGKIIYSRLRRDKVLTATENFINNVRDPKAQIITAINFQGIIIPTQDITVIFFYSSPLADPKPEVFREFLDIPAVVKDVKNRPLVDLIKSIPSNAVKGRRGMYSTISVPNISKNVIAQAANQSDYWGSDSFDNDKKPFLLSASIEPFIPSYLDNEKESAYPHDKSLVLYPICEDMIS